MPFSLIWYVHSFPLPAGLYRLTVALERTLTNSIAAVEAAWGKVAEDLGQDPAYVIAATHGKRAVDNLAQFKLHIKVHEMDTEVQAFEESILFFADAFTKHGPGSLEVSPLTSGAATPFLAPSPSSSTSSPGSGVASTRSPSPSTAGHTHRPSFVRCVTNRLALITTEGLTYEKEENKEPMIDWRMELEQKHLFEAWQVEAAAVDRSVSILPGVKQLMDSIPGGRYAVATSGAKTYAYGCREACTRPVPPPLLATRELGFDAKRCVVFEDSPSGIRAGVASGAMVIAVCMSHERSKIENCGAHFIVDTMEQVRIVVDRNGLKFVVSERQ
ncbi:HAD-like protein [Dichomitus squalens]|uniref:HAD-like protein n=1 Tax=Dichomitus squalens TaxID=114155 RepID=A0A4Q9M9H3_9APHY|nr:HAD-like protein [Dichomitus squalens]